MVKSENTYTLYSTKKKPRMRIRTQSVRLGFCEKSRLGKSEVFWCAFFFPLCFHAGVTLERKYHCAVELNGVTRVRSARSIEFSSCHCTGSRRNVRIFERFIGGFPWMRI